MNLGGCWEPSRKGTSFRGVGEKIPTARKKKSAAGE